VLGETPLSARYSRRGNGALIGYLDAAAGKVYVNEAERERVRWALGATELSGGWAIQRGKESRVYMLEPMAHLDLGRPMVSGNVAVMKDRKCIPYKKGTCINFYRGDKFAYSWLATSDTGICTPTGGATCSELPQQNPVTLYPQKDCKGTPYQSNETWNFCIPA